MICLRLIGLRYNIGLDFGLRLTALLPLEVLAAYTYTETGKINIGLTSLVQAESIQGLMIGRNDEWSWLS